MEEVSRVISEVEGMGSPSPCKLVSAPDSTGLFEFDAGDVTLECEVGSDVDDTVAAMQACAAKEGLGSLDPMTCQDVAFEVHEHLEGGDMGMPDSSTLGMRGLSGRPPQIGAVGRKRYL